VIPAILSRSWPIQPLPQTVIRSIVCTHWNKKIRLSLGSTLVEVQGHQLTIRVNYRIDPTLSLSSHEVVTKVSSTEYTVVSPGRHIVVISDPPVVRIDATLRQRVLYALKKLRFWAEVAEKLTDTAPFGHGSESRRLVINAPPSRDHRERRLERPVLPLSGRSPTCRLLSAGARCRSSFWLLAAGYFFPTIGSIIFDSTSPLLSSRVKCGYNSPL
jgi:hypothetical protein